MFLPVAILAIYDPDERDFMITLYNGHYHMMFAVSYNILHDKELAEDAVSTVLVKLIDKVQYLMMLDQSVLRSYIISAVKNTSINVAEKRSMEQKESTIFENETENEPSSPDDVEYMVLQKKQFEGLQTSLTVCEKEIRSCCE